MKPRVPAQVVASWIRVISAAQRFADTYGGPVGIYCRISEESNGVYGAQSPVFTYAKSDSHAEVRPLADVGRNWTCLGMIG